MNQKYNVEMFSSRVRGRKGYAAELKLENSKNFFSKQKTALTNFY